MGSELFWGQCGTVPTVNGSEVRVSVKSGDIKRIRNTPIRLVKCEEIIPPQNRLQWGVRTSSARQDSYYGARIGSKDNNLEVGFRSSTSGSEGSITPVENQRVGVATLTLGGKFKIKYWNDHDLWFPLADGGDQGDTAGLQMSYNLGNHGFYLTNGWKFETLDLTMRLASGIPDRNSAVAQGDTKVYSRVAFDGIDRGDIQLNTSLFNRDQQRLDIGFWVNSGKVRHAVQSDLVHKTLGIPEFRETDKLEFMMYLKLEAF